MKPKCTDDCGVCSPRWRMAEGLDRHKRQLSQEIVRFGQRPTCCFTLSPSCCCKGYLFISRIFYTQCPPQSHTTVFWTDWDTISCIKAFLTVKHSYTDTCCYQGYNDWDRVHYFPLWLFPTGAPQTLQAFQLSSIYLFAFPIRSLWRANRVVCFQQLHWYSRLTSCEYWYNCSSLSDICRLMVDCRQRAKSIIWTGQQDK